MARGIPRDIWENQPTIFILAISADFFSPFGAFLGHLPMQKFFFRPGSEGSPRSQFRNAIFGEDRTSIRLSAIWWTVARGGGRLTHSFRASFYCDARIDSGGGGCRFTPASALASSDARSAISDLFSITELYSQTNVL